MEIFKRLFLACMLLSLLMFTACKDGDNKPLPDTSLTITSAPITAPVLLPGTYNFSYTIETSVIDPYGDTKITANDTPDWLTLTDNGDGTAVLSGTAPKVTSTRNEKIEIIATNNNSVAKLNFTIVVKDIIKVACVGNSITFGSTLSNRVNDCYPTQLSKLLGDGYNVGNFGKSGATMLRKGDRPYVNQTEYTTAISFAPDIVIIKLGTNDTKPANWAYKSEFKADVNYLIDKFSELSSVSAVYVCTPSKVYQSNYGITDEVVSKGVIPVLKEVTQDRELVLIDIYTAVSGHDECFKYDGVHPDAAGTKLIANEVYRMVSVIR